MFPKGPIFNPNRNPFEDAQEAVQRAMAQQKNILLEIGADWCVWCHRLEQFITSHPELLYLRSMNYVHLRIHVEQDFSQTEFTHHLPPFDGIPHYFVYDPAGKLLHSQDTEPFEKGESYDYEKLSHFLMSWSEGQKSGKLM